MTADILPEQKSPFPCSVLHMWCSSTLFPCVPYPGYLGNGSVSITYFHSKRDLILCIQWMQCLNNNVDPKCHIFSWKKPSLCREQVGPEWAISLLSECSRSTGCHCHGMTPIEPCDTIGSLWEEGVCLSPFGKLSPSHIEGWMMGNLDSCSGSMFILM